MFLNRFFSLSLSLFLCSAHIIYGQSDFDEADMSAEPYKEPPHLQAFTFSAFADAIGESKIRNGYFKGDDISFAIAQAQLAYTFYYSKVYSEGANVALSYTATRIQWPNNVWFNQERFNTVSLTIAGFTGRLPKWVWRSQIAANLDLGEGYCTGKYLNYDGMLWGRYARCNHMGWHIGFILETGMRMDRVYPIIGLDWLISERWKLNLIFPVNVSLEYLLNQNWTLSLAGRVFNVRHRVNREESHGKHLVRYTNTGIELATKYINHMFVFNIHGGLTLGGDYRIANQHNKHPHHYKFKSAGYFGSALEVKF